MAAGAFAALAAPTANAIIIDHCSPQEVGAEGFKFKFKSSGVAICKTGPETAVAGTEITYTLEIHAWGYWDKDFFVDDTVPDGTSLVSVTGDDVWDCSASADPDVHCEALDEDPDNVDGTTITVVVQIGSAITDESILNCATIDQGHVVDSVEAAGWSSDESCWETEITRESDISILKTGPASLVVPGDVVYTITATNNGPSDSDPVTFDDPLPANTTLLSAIGEAWDCTASTATTLSCTTIDGIAVGESASITVTLAVPEGHAGIALENCATVSSGDTSGVTDNDTSCTTIEGGNITVEAAAAVVTPPVTGVTPRFTG